MKVQGAIDGVVVDGERIFLTGWSYAGEPDAKQLVDRVLVEGVAIASITFSSRPDFPGATNHYGFSIELAGTDQLAAVRFGGARCYAIKDKERSAPFPIWSALDGKIMSLLIRAQLASADPDALIGLIEPMLVMARERAQDPGLGVSRHELAVGMASFDGVAIVGRDGYLFLQGGTNNVDQLYDAPLDPGLLAGWTQLIQRRAAALAGEGIRFVQTIVPEKQSVMGERHPRAMTEPTPLMAALTERLGSESYYLDAVGLLRSLRRDGGLDGFRRTDTHLAFPGASALAQALIGRVLGREIAIDKPALAPERLPGDLGSRFGVGDITELTLSAVLEGWGFAERPVTEVRAEDPPGGVHTGLLRHWTCEAPMIDQKVLIFGNSFFERGGHPSMLSWWFARAFRETVFVWSASVDLDLVRRERPDVVIAQTIERFLTSMPLS